MAGACHGRKGKGKGKHAPRHAGGTDVYEEFVNGPDTRIADLPISRLVEQLAVAPLASIGTPGSATECGRTGRRNCACTGTACAQRGRRAHKTTFVATFPGVLGLFCSSRLSIHLLGRAARRPMTPTQSSTSQVCLSSFEFIAMTQRHVAMCRLVSFDRSISTIA